jgi:capsular polysaccharide biosynthesis protein
MKRILDRLMARQQRLLSSLDTPPAGKQPRRTAEQLEAQRATDASAVEAAFACLAEGRLEDAAAQLHPLSDLALDPRVFTTLARIHMLQGRFDAAHDALALAEELDPADPKVAHFTAELLRVQGRFVEELQFRRRVAFATPEPTAEACLHLLTALAKTSAGHRRPPVSEVRLVVDKLRAAPDANRDHLLQAARTVFGVPGFQGEALALYAKEDPPQADEHDVVARWSTLREWCQKQPGERPLHRIAEFGEPGRRPLLALMREALVLPGFQWLPLVEDGRVAFEGLTASRVRTRHEDPNSPLMMASVGKAVFRLPKSVPRIDEPVIALGGNGGYYHDLVEYVGALAVPETLGLGADARLLVPAPLPAHLKELFALLEIDGHRLLPWDPAQPVTVAELWLPTRLASGGRWFDPLLPRWYRQRLAQYMDRAEPQRRLYLSRAGTSRRRVQNEDAIMAALEPLGFESVRPETLSMREQVALFSQARCIVGSSGAALTNMLFTPPGARVVVLQNQHLLEGGGDLYFDALAAACGHAATTIGCAPVRLGPGERAIDADLTVDREALLTALQEGPGLEPTKRST